MKQGSVYRLFTFYGFKSKPELVQRTQQDNISVLICSAKTFPPSISELGSQSGSEVLA
ncbi:unnamed protein product [Brassica oleracea var. botrytis]|uniref:Uncharacterized protein n=1 Tax=Brassica oleracea TaxID=3712 RepID=A0A3P6FAL3_BRAOL|nr:unnamed protein product [Brassica oleracea]